MDEGYVHVVFWEKAGYFRVFVFLMPLVLNWIKFSVLLGF